MTLSLLDRVGLEPHARSRLEQLIAHDHTLGDVIARRAQVVDVIIQDEFTHDVIVAEPPHFLVYDST